MRGIPAALFAVFAIGVGTVAGAQDPDAKQQALRVRAESAAAPFLHLIEGHSAEYRVDPALVMSVITVESNGDPNAYSRSGAMGLMQLMPAVCQDYGVFEPWDPSSNIRGGVSLLANHLRRFKGDLQKVLAAYNAGPRRVDDGSWKNIAETRKYVPAVLAYYSALRSGGDGYLPSDSETKSEHLKGIPAGPSYLDMMFRTVRSAQLVNEPEGVAENGALAEAADAALAKALTPKAKPKDLESAAIKRLAALKVKPSSLKVIKITTLEAKDFEAAWAKQPATPGRFVGLAHASTATGYVWVVVLASF